MEKETHKAEESQGTVREVVGLFGSMETLQAAIDELLTSGFDRSEISLLADENIVREKVGDTPARELEDNREAPRTPYIESESLNEGKAWLTGALFYVAAFAGAGAVMVSGGSAVSIVMGGAIAGAIAALIGVIFARLIGKRENNWAAAQLERGGLLLWARTWNAERERLAAEVMRRNGGADVHAHMI